MEKDNKIKNILIITLMGVIIIALLAVIFLPKIILNNKFKKENEFLQNSNLLAYYIEKESNSLKNNNAEKEYLSICTDEETGNGSNYCINLYEYFEKDNQSIKDGNLIKVLKRAELDPKDYSGVKIIRYKERACVQLTASETGKYKKVTNKISSSVMCEEKEVQEKINKYNERIESE